jgi:hypothetical protein
MKNAVQDGGNAARPSEALPSSPKMPFVSVFTSKITNSHYMLPCLLQVRELSR